MGTGLAFTYPAWLWLIWTNECDVNCADISGNNVYPAIGVTEYKNK